MKILLMVRVSPFFDRQREGLDIPKVQFQSYWQEALISLGHEVKVFRYTASVLFPNRIRIFVFETIIKISPKIFFKINLLKNKTYRLNPANFLRTHKVIQRINKYQPDCIIYAKGISELTGKELTYANKRGIKTLLLSGEDPKIANTAYENDYAKNFDTIVCNDKTHGKAWENVGAKKTITLPYAAASKNIHKKIKLTDRQKKKYQSQVCFCGSLTKERQDFLTYLLKNKIPLKIWGFIPWGISLNKLLKPVY